MEKGDYEKAKQLGLTQKDRWGEGIDHHPMSKRLMCFLAEHDLHDYNDNFCWKTGGDGDNGESLMYEMDAFFEMDDIALDSGPVPIEDDDFPSLDDPLVKRLPDYKSKT